MRKTLLWASILGAAMAYGTGCDGGGDGTGGGGNNTGGGGTGGTTTGGTGGTGGDTSTGGTTTGGAGGTGGTGGSATGGTGGTGGSTMSMLVNGCDPATAEDHSADATTTITSMGLKYSPPCIKISAGASVTFSSNFGAHPLVGGEFVDGMKQPDAGSPIEATSSGNSATFTFPNAGSYGYYCDFHVASGMAGAVFVE